MHHAALRFKRRPSHPASVSVSSAVQVRVVLRVNPPLPEGRGQPPVLRVDRSRKRVTVMEPVGRGQPRVSTTTLDRDGKNLFRTFNVDAAFPPESGQVCALLITFFLTCRSLPRMRCGLLMQGGHQSRDFTSQHGRIVSQSDDLKTDSGWTAATNTHFINSIKLCQDLLTASGPRGAGIHSSFASTPSPPRPCPPHPLNPMPVFSHES